MPAPTVRQLAEACKEGEADKGRTAGAACLELFLLALNEENQEAWSAICAQYQAYVAKVLRKKFGSSLAEDEIDHLINDAFFRMWQAAKNADPPKSFDNLQRCLRYLRMCAGSAATDLLRGRKPEHVSLDGHDAIHELFMAADVLEPDDILVQMSIQKLQNSAWFR